MGMEWLEASGCPGSGAVRVCKKEGGKREGEGGRDRDREGGREVSGGAVYLSTPWTLSWGCSDMEVSLFPVVQGWVPDLMPASPGVGLSQEGGEVFLGLSHIPGAVCEQSRSSGAMGRTEP